VGSVIGGHALTVGSLESSRGWRAATVGVIDA
jgi:hypothetical protein